MQLLCRRFGAMTILAPKVVITSMALLASGMSIAPIAAQNPGVTLGRLPLTGYFEPSGIVQLPDGRMVLVEDEKDPAISLLLPRADQGFTGRPLRLETRFPFLFPQTTIGPLDDLEAITLGRNGFIYAITSQSRTPLGNRVVDREKLVRFKIAGNRAVDPGLLTSLRDQMAGINQDLARAAGILDVKNNNGLNIEGMAYDIAGDRLLFGLRGPVIDGKAVILALPNPDAAFAGRQVPTFADQPIYLDLDAGGIRAMSFDPKLGGFLIISRQQKSGGKFKLWLWDATENQPPRRVRLKFDIDLSKAEGVTPVRHNGSEKIMIVFDNGRKSRNRYAEYLLLSYDQLEIEPDQH